MFGLERHVPTQFDRKILRQPQRKSGAQQRGTIALVTALQSLRITGEVITTPYSFVASSHCLVWNGIKPVFVDVDPETLNLDPRNIEAAITPQTTAILAVHCYGHGGAGVTLSWGCADEVAELVS